jgi:hypothetical protein
MALPALGSLPSGLRWVDAQKCLSGAGSGILKWAVTSGLDGEMVGRCTHRGELTIGRVVKQGTRMSIFIPTVSSEKRYDCATDASIQVLVNGGDAIHLDWVRLRGVVPTTAVHGGWNVTACRPLLIGRQQKGERYNKIGQVDCNHLALDFALGGRQTSRDVCILCVIPD